MTAILVPVYNAIHETSACLAALACAVDADTELQTDAAERLDELDGVTFADLDEDGSLDLLPLLMRAVVRR